MTCRSASGLNPAHRTRARGEPEMSDNSRTTLRVADPPGHGRSHERTHGEAPARRPARRCRPRPAPRPGRDVAGCFPDPRRVACFSRLARQPIGVARRASRVSVGLRKAAMPVTSERVRPSAATGDSAIPRGPRAGCSGACCRATSCSPMRRAGWSRTPTSIGRTTSGCGSWSTICRRARADQLPVVEPDGDEGTDRSGRT